MSTFYIDVYELKRIFAQLNNQIESMQPVMDDIGDALESNIRLNLGQGIQYDGTPMEPIQPRSRQGKRRVSDRPLNDTRQHIYNRITHQADAQSVAIGMNENVGIGAIHQFGGKAGRGRKVKIPARPFLPIKARQVDLPTEWRAEVLTIVQRAIEATLQK